VERNGKGRKGKGWKGAEGKGGYGNEMDSSTWIFVRGPSS